MSISKTDIQCMVDQRPLDECESFGGSEFGVLQVNQDRSSSPSPVNLLFHLVIVLRDFEVIIVVLIVVFLGELLSCLGEVDIAATSALTEDVFRIDLLHVVFIWLVGWVCVNLRSG